MTNHTAPTIFVIRSRYTQLSGAAVTHYLIVSMTGIRAFTLLSAFEHFASATVVNTYYIEELQHNMTGFMRLSSDNDDVEIEVDLLELAPFDDNNIHVFVAAVNEVFLSRSPALARFHQVTIDANNTLGLLPDSTSSRQYTTHMFTVLNDNGFRGIMPHGNGTEEDEPLDAARVSEYSHYFLFRASAACNVQMQM